MVNAAEYKQQVRELQQIWNDLMGLGPIARNRKRRYRKKACAEADAGANVGTGAETMNEVVEAVSEQS